jgi:isoleucyl-tRNA synthetase
MGADILRLWFSSADYRNDVAASPKIMNQWSKLQEDQKYSALSARQSL